MKHTLGLIALCLALGLVVFFALANLLVALARRRPDDALTVQTPRQVYTGYDESKAVAAAKRAGQTAAQMAEQDRLLKQRQSPLRQVRKA